jgi:hypothetical protein
MKAKITKHFRMQPHERIWTAMISSIFLGAQYANEMQLTQIDLKRLAQYVDAALVNMRHAAQHSGSDMTTGENITSILNRYLQDKEAAYTLFTDRVNSGPGRPPKQGILIKNEDVKRLNAIHVQRGEDGVIQMNATRLHDWCKREQISYTTVKDELQRQLHARYKPVYMGAGTFKVEPTKVNVIEVLQADIDHLTGAGN